MIVKVIPESKCPLDAIAVIGEVTKSSRIYLGEKAVGKIMKNADYEIFMEEKEMPIWQAVYTSPETTIEVTTGFEGWWKVCKIVAADIAFEMEVEEPSTTIFIELE